MSHVLSCLPLTRYQLKKLEASLEGQKCQCPVKWHYTVRWFANHVEVPAGTYVDGKKPRKRVYRSITEPCEHLLAAVHELDLEDWSAFLFLRHPRQYRTPPLPCRPMTCLDAADRLAVRVKRRRQGCALDHPADAVPNRSSVPDDPPVSRAAEFGCDDDAPALPPTFRAGAQALATVTQTVRVVCQMPGRLLYSVAEPKMTKRDWNAAVLKIHPEPLGKE